MRRPNDDVRPRVGVPYRTHNEQVKGLRAKYEMYLHAIDAAGAAPVEISLKLTPSELRQMARTLDAVVLPGSPADVDPARYGSVRHPKTSNPDVAREKTDFALLDHCLGEGKPVLAICYGVQILNVHRGGSLVQDIADEVKTTITHAWDSNGSLQEPFHQVKIEPASRIAMAAGEMESRVNSSHHQAIREPGRGLVVTARASDGVIEAVEWNGNSNWVTGVQWHPERMTDDPFAMKLFQSLVAAARSVAVR